MEIWQEPAEAQRSGACEMARAPLTVGQLAVPSSPQRRPGMRDPGIVQVRTGDLDRVVQRIFTAGILLSGVPASEPGAPDSIRDAIDELDNVVRIIRSLIFQTCPPAAPATRPAGPGAREQAPDPSCAAADGWTGRERPEPSGGAHAIARNRPPSLAAVRPLA